jgi:hypothetical protein
MKTVTFIFVSLMTLVLAACSSIPSVNQERLVSENDASAVPGENESLLVIKWNSKKKFPMAVVMDYAKDDNSYDEVTGKLVAQIDPGKTERIIVKNGLVKLHFGHSFYTGNKGWMFFDYTQLSPDGSYEHQKLNAFAGDIPVSLEDNTVMGDQIICHPYYDTINIEISDPAKKTYLYGFKISKSALDTPAAQQAKEAGGNQPRQTMQPSASNRRPESKDSGELDRLIDMYTKGLISEDEYKKAKERLLQ